MSKFNDAFQGLCWKYLSITYLKSYTKKAFLIRPSENEIFPIMGRSVTIWSKTKRSPWLLRERNMLQRCAWVSLEVLQRCASSFLKCHKTGEMGGSWLIWTHSEQFTCDQRFHCGQKHRPLYEYCNFTFFIAYRWNLNRKYTRKAEIHAIAEFC